ncbi:uncharacterized protein LOC123665181 [Melitaea cinxia]|uniref:uncharacterized protein LOC123665181 n=1 Tax=Melitaea cinxia TaxID=113334 RepID=UPI001E270489|nr:uncharacterized protein LOC123665181 [Melitaea cinxia]
MLLLEIVYLIAVYKYVIADGITDDGYILNFDSPIYVCSDEDSQKFIDTSRVEVKRHNETTTYMTGSIEFHKGIQTATMLEVVIEKDIGGSFEMFASHEICDLCKEIQDMESPYAEYLKCFGFPEKCPFPPNTFAIQDFVPYTKDLPINSATAGRYQVTMNIYNNPESNCLNEKIFIACLKLDFIIEPL